MHSSSRRVNSPSLIISHITDDMQTVLCSMFKKQNVSFSRNQREPPLTQMHCNTSEQPALAYVEMEYLARMHFSFPWHIVSACIIGIPPRCCNETWQNDQKPSKSSPGTGRAVWYVLGKCIFSLLVVFFLYFTTVVSPPGLVLISNFGVHA